MTSEQIKRQLEAIKEETKEACKTKESAIKFLTDAGIIPPPTAHIEELSECYFTPDKKTSSATICVNCGKEKMLHTIGDGLKATSIEINPKPVTEELSTPPVREVKGAEEVVIDLRNESALYAKRQGSHDNPDTTAHDFFEGAQFGVQYASRFTTHKEGYSVDGWVRVEDGLPELRVPVLVYTSYGKIDTCYWTGELWNQSVRPQHSNGSVTHWQPLPPPPNSLTN